MVVFDVNAMANKILL